MPETRPEIVVPECGCLKRPDAGDITKPLHVPGCPRLKALLLKYRGTRG